MIRRLIAVVLLCLISVFCCACASSSEAEDGVLVEKKDDSGAVIGYERSSHNADGQLTRLDVYDENQEYLYFFTYEYDDEGRLTQETKYRADGIGVYYTAYTYNDDDKVIEKEYLTMSNGGKITRYDDDGNETDRYFYDKKNELVRHEALDSDGKWHSYDKNDKEITD